MRRLSGMLISYAQAQNPDLRGFTPLLPTQPRLNSYLNIFNDAELVAQRATEMRPTSEMTLNVNAPFLYHFGPAPDGWDSSLQGLGTCRPGDEFCVESGPKMATKVQTAARVAAPSYRVATKTASTSTLAPRTAPATQQQASNNYPSQPATQPASQGASYAQPQQPQQQSQPQQSQPAPYEPASNNYPQQLPDAPASSGGGRTSGVWWILLAIGAGYFVTQR